MIKFIPFLLCFSVTVFAQTSVLVGIAGGTGSGKTTLAEKIHEAFPQAVLLSEDSYYKDLSHLTKEERDEQNFDHPDSLEFSLLRNHLISLKKGFSIEQPIYNFHVHAREKQTELVHPTKIILVEGILLLAAPEVRDLFDIKIFVDADGDIRLLRRIERDMKERSRSFDSIKKQYYTTVKPMHDIFVEPSKKYADIIVPSEEENPVALDLIVTKLREISR